MERLPLSRLKALNVVTNIEDGYFTIREDFFKILIEKYLDGLDLDDRWYVDKYLDVKKAVRTGNTKSAKEHFVKFGFFEGRHPREISVDEAWYLDAYPDVRQGIIDGAVSNGVDAHKASRFNLQTP